jgi:hypothetical protein
MPHTIQDKIYSADRDIKYTEERLRENKANIDKDTKQLQTIKEEKEKLIHRRDYEMDVKKDFVIYDSCKDKPLYRVFDTEANVETLCVVLDKDTKICIKWFCIGEFPIMTTDEVMNKVSNK